MDGSTARPLEVRRWPALALLCGGLLLAACGEPAGSGAPGAPGAPGASGEQGKQRAPEPVFVFAVDGFEWSVILPLLRAGEMPHLEALMERGTYGLLETMEPNQSPRLWTTMATGKPPSEHGILGFVKGGDDGEETTRHYTSADRRTKAFWNILTERGITNDTIGWWVTYPVEEVLGVMVAQTNTVGSPIKKGSLVQGQTGQVWPPDQEQRVLGELAGIDRNLDGVIEEIFGAGSASESKDWRKCRWVFRADSTYVSVLHGQLAERAPATVTTLFLGGTDVVGHGFWDTYEPEGFSPPTKAVEVQANQHVIPTYYRYVDRVLGELLAQLPPDTCVLVISDHGMRAPPAGSKAARLRLGFHDDQTQGAFLAAGPGIRELSSTPAREVELEDLETLGHIADVCPTLLATVGVPFGEDMLGRPIRRLFTDAFLEQHPLLSIPTHDDAAWLGSRPAELTHEDPERLEQLRKLGYLDGQDD